PSPPDGFVSPMLWGVEEQVTARFEAAGVARENISFVKIPFTFNAPYPSSKFVDVFRLYYGPTMNAFDAAEAKGLTAELQRELEALFVSQNKSTVLGSTSIAATFLKVTVLC
ncbi:MAG: methyltransferase type 11, partial [Mucilaginibacter sp.]